MQFPFWSIPYENCSATKILLPAGYYVFEVWGASGASGTGGRGGLGGYSRGEISLEKETKIFVNVGSQGMSTTGGCNGGGSSSDSLCGAGGGATDIRLIYNNLLSRVIVAGGGGGGADLSDETGGAGGGLNGGNAGNDNDAGKGGGQFSETIYCRDGKTTSCGKGTFGKGSDKNSGGGGGWFGGSSSADNDGGGGGSGYILTSDSFKPAGYLLNETKYYLKNAASLDGTQSFPSPTSSANEVGHNGNGVARITLIKALTDSRFRVSCFKRKTTDCSLLRLF